MNTPRMSHEDLRALVSASLLAGQPDYTELPMKRSIEAAGILLSRLGKITPLESKTGELEARVKALESWGRAESNLEAERLNEVAGLRSKLNKAQDAEVLAVFWEKDARLCRGMVAAQEAMIQAALEPLGCQAPFDNHAAEWAADEISDLRAKLEKSEADVASLVVQGRHRWDESVIVEIVEVGDTRYQIRGSKEGLEAFRAQAAARVAK